MNNEQEKRIVLRAISHMAKATELMRIVDTNTRAWTSALNMLDTLWNSITMIAYGDETLPVKKTKKKPVKKKKPAIRKKTK